LETGARREVRPPGRNLADAAPITSGVLAEILELLYPERCPACDAFTDGRAGLCTRCAVSLYPLGSACPRCAEPQAAPAAVLCFRCVRDPPAFGPRLGALALRWRLAVAIRRWESTADQAPADGRAGRARSPPWPRSPSPPRRQTWTRIVPVPVHARRPPRARLLPGRAPWSPPSEASVRDLPRVEVRMLQRARATVDQAGPPRAARQANVRDGPS
jgi:predicted amidophosphoribosyltransferase